MGSTENCAAFNIKLDEDNSDNKENETELYVRTVTKRRKKIQ